MWCPNAWLQLRCRQPAALARTFRNISHDLMPAIFPTILQDAFRKFKGPEGYTKLDFVPTNVQVLFGGDVAFLPQPWLVGGLQQKAAAGRAKWLARLHPGPHCPIFMLVSCLQDASVSITSMRMLDNSSAEIRWRLTGKLGVLPVDVAGEWRCLGAPSLVFRVRLLLLWTGLLQTAHYELLIAGCGPAASELTTLCLGLVQARRRSFSTC